MMFAQCVSMLLAKKHLMQSAAEANTNVVMKLSVWVLVDGFGLMMVLQDIFYN